MVPTTDSSDDVPIELVVGVAVAGTVLLAAVCILVLVIGICVYKKPKPKCTRYWFVDIHITNLNVNAV